MSRRVVLSGLAAKEFRRISDRRMRARLVAAVKALCDDPHPPGSQRLAGYEAIWRIRVGDFRVCYSLEDGDLVVLILSVAPRRDVYERLRRRLR